MRREVPATTCYPPPVKVKRARAPKWSDRRPRRVVTHGAAALLLGLSTGCGASSGSAELKDPLLTPFRSADLVARGTIVELGPPPEIKTGFLGVARQTVRIRVDEWLSGRLALGELDVSFAVVDPPTATSDCSSLDVRAFPVGKRLLVPMSLIRRPVGDVVGEYVLAVDADPVLWTDEVERRVRDAIEAH